MIIVVMMIIIAAAAVAAFAHFHPCKGKKKRMAQARTQADTIGKWKKQKQNA